MEDYYELLGVSSGASTSDIRKAYAALARENHPDRFPDGARKDAASKVLQDITTAFNTLSNERQRSEYDQQRERPQPTTPEEIARDAFERHGALLGAAQLDPKNAGLLVDLALLLNQQGLRVRARRVLEKAQRLAPSNTRVVRAAGEIGSE